MSKAQESALEELEKLFKRKGQHNQRFVTYEDLEALWTPKLEKFSGDVGLRLTPDELKQVQKHQLRILSTLISIGWEMLHMFRQYFLLPKCYDDKLPLSRSSPELKYLSTVRRTQFEEAQYIYIPVKLGPSGSLEVYCDRARLPFVEKSEHIGDGSYGDVFKEVIAARHLIRAEKGSTSQRFISDVIYTLFHPKNLSNARPVG